MKRLTLEGLAEVEHIIRPNNAARNYINICETIFSPQGNFVFWFQFCLITLMFESSIGKATNLWSEVEKVCDDDKIIGGKTVIYITREQSNTVRRML
jgi:hypothetical protein